MYKGLRLKYIGAVLTIIVTLFIVFISSQKTCDSGYVKLMMAPGDHCVLDPVSQKCGGHVNDFSDAHHKRECVSKANFERLWKSGLCHYDNDTPIINRQGYVMCKPTPNKTPDIKVTMDGLGDWNIRYIAADYHDNWTMIQINGHEILSTSIYITLRGNDKAIEYVASLPKVNREDFLKHIEWLKTHETTRAVDWNEYCKDLPEVCEQMKKRKNS
jgi:hypothetical protein